MRVDETVELSPVATIPSVLTTEEEDVELSGKTVLIPGCVVVAVFIAAPAGVDEVVVEVVGVTTIPGVVVKEEVVGVSPTSPCIVSDEVEIVLVVPSPEVPVDETVVDVLGRVSKVVEEATEEVRILVLETAVLLVDLLLVAEISVALDPITVVAEFAGEVCGDSVLLVKSILFWEYVGPRLYVPPAEATTVAHVGFLRLPSGYTLRSCRTTPVEDVPNDIFGF